mmetsp:Transcript_19233/g.40705  ORF Transcript_19233/g.40705 Transcript_19233/m.40705 type:complete len:336 (-) Transcript_19233:202-1209(-)
MDRPGGWRGDSYHLHQPLLARQAEPARRRPRALLRRRAHAHARNRRGQPQARALAMDVQLVRRGPDLRHGDLLVAHVRDRLHVPARRALHRDVHHRLGRAVDQRAGARRMVAAAAARAGYCDAAAAARLGVAAPVEAAVPRRCDRGGGARTRHGAARGVRHSRDAAAKADLQGRAAALAEAAAAAAARLRLRRLAHVRRVLPFSKRNGCSHTCEGGVGFGAMARSPSAQLKALVFRPSDGYCRVPLALSPDRTTRPTCLSSGHVCLRRTRSHKLRRRCTSCEGEPSDIHTSTRTVAKGKVLSMLEATTNRCRLEYALHTVFIAGRLCCARDSFRL